MDDLRVVVDAQLLRVGEEAQRLAVQLGLQAVGEAGDNLKFWANAAYVTGDSDEGDGSHDIRGYGLDLVATYVPDLAWDPSVSLGFAFGSGDGDPDDGVDRNFRQTGLQANNANFNGVTRFKYYGEAFDPELHQAMSMQESADAKPNTVLGVMQKGYTLSGRLIRPAMVMVSKAPANAETENQSE